MKEICVAFIIALVLGSVYNGMNGDQNIQPDSFSPGTHQSANAQLEQQQATAGQELVVDIDEGSFQGYVLDSREPVLVEFYTETCPYCVKMGPTLGKVAFNGQGVIRLCKINASKAPSLAERYSISGVPAFALFVEGHLVDSTSGAKSFEELRTWLTVNNIDIPASSPQT